MTMIMRSAIAAMPISVVLLLSGATPAMAHSSLVTVGCSVDHPDTRATDIVIRNGQNNGTGWIRGYSVTATTTSGKTVTRTNRTVPIRIAAHGHVGWVEGWQPLRIAQCSASILWAR